MYLKNKYAKSNIKTTKKIKAVILYIFSIKFISVQSFSQSLSEYTKTVVPYISNNINFSP